MAALTFHAEERLKSHHTIARLFKEGQSFSVYPLRVVWVPVEKEENHAYPAQFALTVPKKNFKRAVDRNRLRRKIREAYRLQKGVFYQEIDPDRDVFYALMIIYVAKDAKPFSDIDKAMKKLLDRLLQRIKT